MGFTFKSFHICDDDLGMPVSTDAVLLGAWAPLEGAQAVLDLGAGSGLLALMAAQRCNAAIKAIEIDANAAAACESNFAASPWAERISIIHGDATDENVLKGEVFTHILCNPPYFETGPISAKPGRAQARHTGSLDFVQLCRLISKHLSPKGTASLVLPIESEPGFMTQVACAGLGIKARIAVCTVEGKLPRRVLYALGQGEAECKQGTLVVRDREGHYTQAMQALTRDFYLKL